MYIPLGGNRKGIKKQIRNIAVVWMLTGIWHGASWNFVLWGVYYGALLIVEKFVLKDILTRLPRIFRHIYALFFVLIGWVQKMGENNWLITIVRLVFYAGIFFLGVAYLVDATYNPFLYFRF